MLRPRTGRRLLPWLAASSIASTAAILVIVETLQPSTSLAQVATAQAQQTEFTIVTTEFFVNRKGLKVVACRDGVRWSIRATSQENSRAAVDGMTGITVMDGKCTVGIRHNAPRTDTVEIDGPTDMNSSQAFDIQRILRSDGTLTKHYGVEWRGRFVDQFEVHSTYRDRGRSYTATQTVTADAKSHLPLRVQEFSDDRSSGQTTDFTYGPPAGDPFKVEIPPSAKIFDLKKERAELKKNLIKGAVLVDAEGGAQVLIPAPLARTVPPILRTTVTGSRDQFLSLIATRYDLSPPKLIPYDVGGKLWALATLTSNPTTDFNRLKPFQQARASLKIGESSISSIPVFHVSSAIRLLLPLQVKSD